MPRLSTWYIRAALVYLLLGFTWGALILIHKGIPLHPLVWRLFPAHIDFMLFGWTVQLVMGTAYWILPRYSRTPIRGSPYPPWFAFWALNLGILANFSITFLPALAWMRPLGDLAKMLAVLAFAIHAWPRVKGFRA